MSSAIPISSLDGSQVGTANQTRRFGKTEDTVGMIWNMLANFPSCWVLDADGKPASWILTYESCAMGMLYTLPEHRGEGYAKVPFSTMASTHSGLASTLLRRGERGLLQAF